MDEWKVFNDIQSRNCRGALYESVGMVIDMMCSDGLILNPEQLASISDDIMSKRLRDFAMAEWQKSYGNGPDWLDHIHSNVDTGLCEKYGHVGDAYGDPESGRTDFSCIFCNFDVHCYM